MSNTLLVFNTNDKKFDENELIEVISSMEGLDNVDVMYEAENTSYIGNYIYGKEDMYFEISKDMSCIRARSLEDAGLNFAFELQQKLSSNLLATDTNYSFLCQLNKISSIDELKSIVEQGIHMEE